MGSKGIKINFEEIELRIPGMLSLTYLIYTVTNNSVGVKIHFRFKIN